MSDHWTTDEVKAMVRFYREFTPRADAAPPRQSQPDLPRGPYTLDLGTHPGDEYAYIVDAAGDIIRRVHERYILAMNDEIADALDGAGLTLYAEAYRLGNVSALGFGEVTL